MRSQINNIDATHLTDYLRRNAALTPDKLALDDDKIKLTWRQLWHEVEPRAYFLSSLLGNSEPQIVGLLFPNRAEYVITYLAVIHAGHMVLPIDVIFKPLEIDAVIDQVKPALVITDSFNRPRINSKTAPLMLFEELKKAKTRTKSEFIKIPPRDQIASLFFTSGTTGRPKLAPNTHANHIWNIKACSQAWGWTNNDSLLVSVRLSHMLGLVMGLSGALYHGNTLYLQDRFDPTNTLEFLSTGKVSQFSHGPLAYARLLEAAHAKDYDLSKVKLFISGSAPLSPHIWHEFKKRFGHEILEVYGTTETGRIASNLKDERLPGSPGRPLPGVDIKFSDQNEILIKSPGVFPGYFQNREATKESMTADGYWRTGDTGEIRDGRLYLKGRQQEKIRKSGYTLSPRDIEWALHKMPRIKEIYVLGLQRPNNPDDLVVYYLVSDASLGEVMAFCKTNLPSVWRPDKVIFVDQIPRTPSGKPQLVRLRDLAQNGVAL